MLRLLVCSLLWCSASVARAQSTVAADFTLGFSRASSKAEYRDSGRGSSMDLFISRAGSTSDAAPIVLGISAAFDGSTAGHDAVCKMMASGGCAPPHPSTATLAALAGWQNSRRWLRVFAGPALAHADQIKLGVAGRIDLALPASSSLAITANVRGLLLPSVRSEMYQIVSFGLGLRMQERGLNR